MVLRPHGRALVRPAAVLVLALGVGAFAAGWVPDGEYQSPGRLAVAAVVTGVLLRWALRPYLRWLSTRVIVTDRRLMTRTGVLTRSGRDVPLGRIVDLGHVRTPLQRLLRCGTLLVDTSGDRGGLVLRDVPRVEQVQRELYDLLDRLDEPDYDSGR